MHTWQWQTWQEMPYLTCSLLEPWQHGFFTQHFSPRSPIDLVEVLHPEAQVYRTKQVHGNVVIDTGEMSAVSPMPEVHRANPNLHPADGILTQQQGEAVWVCSADCTPVLVGDAQTGQVAAIHSGWRGTAAGIVLEAIAQFQEQGSQLADLRVAMGPAISGEVYQVSEDVAAKVGQTLMETEAGEGVEAILHRLDLYPNSPVLSDPESGRVRLDIRRAIALQLDGLGLSPQQVEIAPYCTYQEPDHFFSYRRNGKKNVQWSGIVSCAVG